MAQIKKEFHFLSVDITTIIKENKPPVFKHNQMAARPQSRPSNAPQPPQRPQETGLIRYAPPAPDQPLAIHPQETEADRRREAETALHGPRITILDPIHRAVFSALEAEDFGAYFDARERYAISSAIADKLHSIINFVIGNGESVSLLQNALRQAIEESIDWELKGAPANVQKRFHDRIFEQAFAAAPKPTPQF